MPVSDVADAMTENINAVGGELVEVIDGVKADPETLKEVTAAAIKSMTEYVQGAGEFVAEQAPHLCNEIAAFGMAKAAIFIVVFTIFAIVCSFVGAVWMKYVRAANWSSEDKEPMIFFSFVAKYVAPVLIMIIPLVNLMTLAKAYFAPRLFILDYLMKLVERM